MTKKLLRGKVISTKMQKTVVVLIERVKMHPVYKKAMKRSTKFKVRDEVGVSVGDMVEIEETKPYAKSVSWKVVKVVEKEER